MSPSRPIDPIRELAFEQLRLPARDKKSPIVADLMTGRKEIAIDAKNRLYLPAAFREALGNGAPVIAAVPGDNSAIFLFSTKEFDSLLRSAFLKCADPKSTAGTVETVTLLLNRSESINVDNAGRIGLPSEFLELVGLERKPEVLVVGSGNFLEIKPLEKPQDNSTRKA